MKALTVVPGKAGTLALADVAEPAADGAVLVDVVAAGAELPDAGELAPLDLGGLNREIVLQNDIVFGSVNANRGHYTAAAEALRQADRGWLDRLLTRRVPLTGFEPAFDRGPGDVKVVLEVAAPAGAAPAS